ncbi:MAG: hypothetical protein Q8P67_05065 [archaeon]|nr:hypothetical protein [archaeon]
MAIICDSKQLRALFLYNATDAPDKDPVAELLWTTGGGAEPPLQASRSFEQLASLLQQAEAFTSEAIMMSFQRNKSQPKQDPSNAATPGGPSGQSPSPAAVPSRASKAATSSASETPAFKALFAREAVPASAPVAAKSLLTVAMANAPRPPQAIQVLIHLSYGKPLRLSVPENILVKDLIQAAIKQHSNEHRFPPLQANPAAYELNKAENDGSVDDSMPPFTPVATINRFGRNFCLVPKEKEPAPSTPPAVSPAASSSTSQPRAAANRYVLERRESTTGLGSKVLYVVLPDGTKNGLSVSGTVGEAVQRVCLKRGLDPLFYYLTEPDEDLQLGHAMTLSAIGAEELVLRAKPGAPPMAVSTVDADQEKLAFKSYTVSRVPSRTMHRFTSDQVTLGFDKDRLYVERKKKKLIFFISDLSKVALGDKPTHFTISFLEAKDQCYIAPSPEMAKEIQTRLEYCIKHFKSPSSSSS